MHTVFRVEHSTIPSWNSQTVMSGPYSGQLAESLERGDVIDRLLSDHNLNRGAKPSMSDDCLHPNFGAYHCACPSLESLVDWFESHLEPLILAGFVIRKYTVWSSSMSRSGKQCFFKATEDNIESITEIKLNDAIKMLIY